MISIEIIENCYNFKTFGLFQDESSEASEASERPKICKHPGSSRFDFAPHWKVLVSPGFGQFLERQQILKMPLRQRHHDLPKVHEGLSNRQKRTD